MVVLITINMNASQGTNKFSFNHGYLIIIYKTNLDL